MNGPPACVAKAKLEAGYRLPFECGPPPASDGAWSEPILTLPPFTQDSLARDLAGGIRETDTMLEHDIGVLLKEQGLTLATAESCTGGLVGHRITNVPGSSAYYLGGVVAYAYEAKEMLLDVCHETLLAFGAVSEETAREMARGARLRLNADLGLSVTGIAGPAGGTPTKPVGLVYIALVTPDGEWCHRHVCQGNRRTNKAHFAQAALQAVEAYLAGRQVKGHNSERGAKDGVH